MAIVGSNLAAAAGSANPTIATTSISPTANALILVWIHMASSTATVSGITGAGMTWVQIGSFVDVTNGHTMTAFRSLNSSPTPGALTITMSTTITIQWSIDQFTGVNTSGTNGSGAVVANTGSLTSNAGHTGTGATTSNTMSLSALRNTDNVSAGFVKNGVTGAISPGAGYSTLGSIPGAGLQTEYALPGLTTVNFTWASQTVVSQLTALEIARDPSDGQDWFGTDPTRTLNSVPNVGYGL